MQLGNFTGLLDAIKPAIQATNFQGERTSKNSAFVDAVALSNVRLTADQIRTQSPILADLEKKGQIKIAGSMYELETGRLTFIS